MATKVVVTLTLDFDQLRHQKAYLLSLLLTTRKYDKLEGILNIIDEIQDQAVDANGVDDEVVFGKKVD